MIERYDSLIIVIDKEKNKMLSLKFKIIDGHLYAYNMYEAIENRKMLEVKRINNVDVSTIINKIQENDLYNIDTLKKYGINTETKFVLDLLDNGITKKFDILSYESDDKIFYKKHNINEIIGTEQLDVETNSPASQNIMLDYASTNLKALLKILKSNSLSKIDKNNFDELLKIIESINDNYSNSTNNLDMLFLSSQLLLTIEDDIEYIPEYIVNFISKHIVIDFNGETFKKNNKSILTNGEIDYIKFVNMIRNAIAHSNYKVLESGMIEFYDDGKKGQKKMEYTISKKDVKFLFYQLYNYKYLKGTFPFICETKKVMTPNSLNNNEIREYLKGLILYDISNYKILNGKEEYLEYGLYRFRNSSNEKEVEFRFNYYIKPYLDSNYKLEKKILTENDIEYILSSIKEMGEDYFYNLGSTSQIKVINSIIKYKTNKKYELIKNVDDMVESNYNTNESLTQKAHSYINLKSKIEILITSLLNTLFLFCYNQNSLTIDTSNIKFPENVYKQYMNSKIKEFYVVSKEAADYQKTYISLLKAVSSNLIKSENFDEIEKNIKKTQNTLSRRKNEIYLSGIILENNATDDIYKEINKDILNNFRDCLAHGRLKIENIDINNIGKTLITFYNLYEGQEKFKATITLETLINSINQKELLTSLLNENTNFNNHKFSSH